MISQITSTLSTVTTPEVNLSMLSPDVNGQQRIQSVGIPVSLVQQAITSGDTASVAATVQAQPAASVPAGSIAGPSTPVVASQGTTISPPTPSKFINRGDKLFATPGPTSSGVKSADKSVTSPTQLEPAITEIVVHRPPQKSQLGATHTITAPQPGASHTLTTPGVGVVRQATPRVSKERVKSLHIPANTQIISVSPYTPGAHPPPKRGRGSRGPRGGRTRPPVTNIMGGQVMSTGRGQGYGPRAKVTPIRATPAVIGGIGAISSSPLVIGASPAIPQPQSTRGGRGRQPRMVSLLNQQGQSPAPHVIDQSMMISPGAAFTIDQSGKRIPINKTFFSGKNRITIRGEVVQKDGSSPTPVDEKPNLVVPGSISVAPSVAPSPQPVIVLPTVDPNNMNIQPKPEPAKVQVEPVPEILGTSQTQNVVTVSQDDIQAQTSQAADGSLIHLSTADYKFMDESFASGTTTSQPQYQMIDGLLYQTVQMPAGPVQDNMVDLGLLEGTSDTNTNNEVSVQPEIKLQPQGAPQEVTSQLNATSQSDIKSEEITDADAELLEKTILGQDVPQTTQEITSSQQEPIINEQVVSSQQEVVEPDVAMPQEVVYEQVL